jgi:hypothetical protein
MVGFSKESGKTTFRKDYSSKLAQKEMFLEENTQRG